MSTDWELECQKCGRGIGWRDREKRPRFASDLTSLALRSWLLVELARLAKRFKEADLNSEWQIELTHWQFDSQEIGYLADDCEHDFAVKSEWGRWADPKCYPIGSRLSNAFRTPRGELCSGRPHPVLEVATVWDVDLYGSLAAGVVGIGKAVDSVLLVRVKHVWPPNSKECSQCGGVFGDPQTGIFCPGST